MTTNLEKQLQGHMPDDMWKAFREKCIAWHVPMNEDSLQFGSVFLECKAWFDLGWEAKEKQNG